MHKTPDSHAHGQPPPDQRPLSDIQAHRLSALTGIAQKEIAGAHVADLAERFRWQVDAAIFRFEFVCGRVVKTDPHTGIDSPVPFATVHVYDVDCSFFGYFPTGWPWSWLFPIHCRREELATVTTDACGNFCALVPRFDIDWIRRWRFERICYPEIFRRPSIGDIIAETVPPHIGPPNPGDPLKLLADGGMTFRRLGEVLGTQRAEQLLRATAGRTIGGDSTAYRRLSAMPAFGTLPPPLPAQLHERSRADGPQALARHLNLDAAKAAHFDLSYYAGPFWRCTEILVSEWVPILDVPDIAFKVTQNIAGVNQTIYDDGYFDVDWDSGDISNVTLHAKPNAVATFSCDAPTVDCSAQGIEFIGLMPLLDPAYHSQATGLATRPNQPHNSNGAKQYPSYAPYTGTLQLYGCNHFPGAEYYRVGYTFEGGTPTFFTGVTWPVYPAPPGAATTTHVDPNGWYKILDPDAWSPSHLLFHSGAWASGVYELWLEYADASKNLLDSSAHVKIRVDNDVPDGKFDQLRWRRVGGIWSAPVELTCPVIRRPKGTDIELEVRYSAWATHLRSVEISGSGCGATATLQPSPTNVVPAFWYSAPSDTAFNGTAVYQLSQGALDGAYGFALTIDSRAFNPAGHDGGPLQDWVYDPAFLVAIKPLPVAIVTEGT
jgi:hypothetical protein